ncbi:nuclear transport factor 2 family protein [Longispora sp. K20-0274]|uniref:YybH family protein n=1 Tax=Longispora sp. K20-0274 TaxID=3088255 RepID=UPI00399B9F89
MDATDDFHRFLERQAEAEEAMVAGDVAPRLMLWTRNDPVSLLGAWGPNRTGWAEVGPVFEWVARRLGQGTYSDFRYDVEVAQAVGDMAYTVGFERFTSTNPDGSTEPVTVRVTHVYRREAGEWRIVHRHGDLAPVDESPPGGA